MGARLLKRGIRTFGGAFLFATPLFFPAAPFSYASVRWVEDGCGTVSLGDKGVVAVDVDQNAKSWLSEHLEGHNDLTINDL